MCSSFSLFVPRCDSLHGRFFCVPSLSLFLSSMCVCVCGSRLLQTIRTRKRRSRKKRDHSHTHPHTHVSQAPTRTSRTCGANRLRTTESPAARVTRLNHGTSTTPRCQPLTPRRYRPRRRRRDVVAATAAAAFGQTGRSSSGRRKRQSSSHVAADEWGRRRNDSRDDSVASATTNADVRRRGARSLRRSRMTFPIRGYSRRADIQRDLVLHACCTPRFTRGRTGVSTRPEIRHRFLLRELPSYSFALFKPKLAARTCQSLRPLRLILPLNKKNTLIWF